MCTIMGAHYWKSIEPLKPSNNFQEVPNGHHGRGHGRGHNRATSAY